MFFLSCALWNETVRHGLCSCVSALLVVRACGAFWEKFVLPVSMLRFYVAWLMVQERIMCVVLCVL